MIAANDAIGLKTKNASPAAINTTPSHVVLSLKREVIQLKIKLFFIV